MFRMCALPLKRRNPALLSMCHHDEAAGAVPERLPSFPADAQARLAQGMDRVVPFRAPVQKFGQYRPAILPAIRDRKQAETEAFVMGKAHGRRHRLLRDVERVLRLRTGRPSASVSPSPRRRHARCERATGEDFPAFFCQHLPE